MHWQGHTWSGAAAGLSVALVVDTPPLFGSELAGKALTVGVATLAANFADLDHRSAKLVRALGPLGWVLCRIVIYAAKAEFAVTRGPGDHRHTNGHRMLSHQMDVAPVLFCALTLAGLVGFGAPLEWTLVVLLAEASGVVAGIAGDGITVGGLPPPLIVVVYRAVRGEEKRWRSWWLLPELLRFRVERDTTMGETVATGLIVVTCAALAVGVLGGWPWLWRAVVDLSAQG